MKLTDTTGRPTRNPRYVSTSRTSGWISVRVTTWERPQPEPDTSACLVSSEAKR